MSALRLIAAIGVLLAAGATPERTTIIVKSSTVGEELQFKAVGGPDALKVVKGTARNVADTVWATTPTEISADVLRGQVTVVSMSKDKWVDVHVEGGKRGSFTISAAGVRILEDARGIEVSGLPR